MYPLDKPVKKTVIITAIRNLGFRVDVHESDGKSLHDFLETSDLQRFFLQPEVYGTIVYVRLADGQLFEVDSIREIYRMNVPAF